MSNRLIDDCLKDQSNQTVEKELINEVINDALTRLSELYYCKSECELSNTVKLELYILGDLVFNCKTKLELTRQLTTQSTNHQLNTHSDSSEKIPRIELLFSWILKSIQAINNHRQRRILICITIATICNNRFHNTSSTQIANSLGISAPDFSQRKNRFIKKLKQEIKRIQNNLP